MSGNRIREHILELQETTEVSLYHIAHVAGISSRTVHDFMNGGRSSMERKNGAKILAVTIEEIRSTSKRPREEYMWRTGVLMAHGYTMNMKRISEVAAGRIKLTVSDDNLKHVSPKLWARLDRAWKILSTRMADPILDKMEPRHIQAQKTVAAKNGFYPFAAYDNEFDQYPADTSTAVNLLAEDTRELEETVGLWIDRGLDKEGVEQQLQTFHPDANLGLMVDRVKARKRRAA